MLKLTKGTGQQTITFYPEVTSSYSGLPSSSIWLKVSQDYTDSYYTRVSGSILNTPNSYSPRIVMSVDQSGLPSKTGLYTSQVEERIEINPKWGTTEIKFNQADWRWQDESPDTYPITLDTDRATLQGTDDPQIRRYSNSNTPYTAY